MPFNPRPRVLCVDDSENSCEVLRTAKVLAD
jgi:hypothetical protein